MPYKPLLFVTEEETTAPTEATTEPVTEAVQYQNGELEPDELLEEVFEGVLLDLPCESK